MNRAWLTDYAAVNKNLQVTSDQSMLLNIVRLHYHDSPEFIQIGNIQATYVMNSGVNVSYGIANLIPFSLLGKSSSASAADAALNASFQTQPSITYSPIEGESFTKQFLSEITPETLCLLIKAGWPAELITGLFVASIVDEKGKIVINDPDDPTYPAFRKWRQWLQNAQIKHDLNVVTYEGPASGSFSPGPGGLGVVTVTNPPVSTSATAPSRQPSEHNSSELGALVPGERCIKAGSHYISLRSITFRTLLDAMKSASRSVERPGSEKPPDSSSLRSSKRIRCSLLPPSNAAVCVRYKGRYYYIDNNDVSSKDALTMLALVCHIQSSTRSTAPVLTIPVTR